MCKHISSCQRQHFKMAPPSFQACVSQAFHFKATSSLFFYQCEALYITKPTACISSISQKLHIINAKHCISPMQSIAYHQFRRNCISSRQSLVSHQCEALHKRSLALSSPKPSPAGKVAANGQTDEESIFPPSLL